MTEETQDRASQPLDPSQAPEGQPEQQPGQGPEVPGSAPAEQPQDPTSTPAPEGHAHYVVRDGQLVQQAG